MYRAAEMEARYSALAPEAGEEGGAVGCDERFEGGREESRRWMSWVEDVSRDLRAVGY